MQKKWVFLHARFLVLLMLAGVGFGLAVPEVADAHNLGSPPTIDWIKIYHIPESALKAKASPTDPTRPTVTGVWPPDGFLGTGGLYEDLGTDFWRARGTGLINGYVPIDSTTGEPVGGIPATPDMTLGEGQILGIAARVGPVNSIEWHLKLDMAFDQGGMLSNRTYINHRFDPAHVSSEDPPNPNHNLPKFTVLYCYKVRAGDLDVDGGWFEHYNNDNTPFAGHGGGYRRITYADHVSPNTHQHEFDVRTLQFDTSGIVYPKIESIRPRLSRPTFDPSYDGWDLYWRDEGASLPPKSRWVQDENSPYTITSTPQGTEAQSRYAAFYETCFYVWHHAGRPDLDTNSGQQELERLLVDAGCITTERGIAYPANLAPRKLGIYGVGETIRFQIKFSEPVYANPDTRLKILLHSGNNDAEYATLVGTPQPVSFGVVPGGSGPRMAVRSDDDNNLTFEYVVKEGDWAYGTGGIEIFHPFATLNRLLPDGTVDDRPFNPGRIQQWNVVYEITDAGGNPFDGHVVTTKFRGRQAPENWSGGFEHQIDTIRPEVRIERLDGETGGVTGPFEIDIHFWNNIKNDRSARDVPEHVTSIDTAAIADALGDGWSVEEKLLGFDYRWLQEDSLAHTFASVVHRATFTPPLNFRGDVAVQVPAGVATDLARNENLASNTLTVSVDNPLRVVETPEIVAPPAGAYTANDKIEVEVTYDRENLRYEGDNPPYLTLYLGEEVPANARHATWQTAEDTNSTKVTFAYTVAATDTVAEAVRVPSVNILVPEGTTLLSGSPTATAEQQVGTEDPAAGSGAAPKTVPAVEPLPSEDMFGREVSPIVSDTPVVPFTPILEESDPKSAASAVPRSPVVFNELGNGSGDTEDWLELRNVTGSDVSLKDWELSVVADGKKEDTSLIMFPDVSVPANGLLLITNSEPDKTPLAGGENKGLSHAFLVDAGLSLPDDGKFLLILRNAKEKLGLNEAFIDVAGGGGSDTDAFVREQEGLYDTHVWPLQVLQSPGGDTEDALSSGKVWQRAKADIVGYHKDAWAEAAFTGIGYDRAVSASAATAGTPGYPNGAVKTVAATPRGAVTFSEIMLDSSGGTLPQWIELYNHSKTEALNLNRWQLEIQNEASADLIGRPIVTLTLQEKVIQPNQTLLIVAGDARASSADVFPEDRVYNLLKLHEKNLRIKTARDTFLSTEGFYLKLTDRNGNLVDEVGNTDGHRRTDDAPSWAVPLSGLEASRSSLVRRYKDGVAERGTRRAGWASAARFKQFKVESLHYGHVDDIGTPGYRQGGALPVELSSFTVARTDAGAVVVTWTTESEVDNAGFNLRRSERRDSGFTLLNPVLIAGAGTTGERQVYTFTDTSAKPGVEYYYQIEEVSLGGKREALALRMLRGPVSAANRMLTTFGEVKRRE